MLRISGLRERCHGFGRTAVVSLLAGIGALVVCCRSGDLPTQARGSKPEFEILDGAHAPGNSHFYFLPPIVSAPGINGTFDASFSPIVRICEWNDNGCRLPLVAEFTTGTGSGAERVRVNVTDQNYLVNWNTNRFALDVRKAYRILVLIGTTEIGHADVDLVSTPRELRLVNADLYVPLLIGTTLPIKFRIEAGVLCAGQVDCREQLLGPGGGTVLTTSGLAGIQVPDGALDHPIHLAVRRVTGACLPATSAAVSGCFEILTDQAAGFTLRTGATVGVCGVEPGTPGVLHKFDVTGPSLTEVALDPVAVSFLDCPSVTPGDLAIGGSASSFSSFQVTYGGKWSLVPGAIPRGRAAVTPLSPTGDNTCLLTDLTPYHTGQFATQVLVTGGTNQTAGFVLADAEVVDAATFQVVWSGTMNTARAEHTATLLSDNTVLIAGGLGDGFNEPLATAELFVHDAGGFHFIPVGNMSVPRAHHTATLLGDGRVLITGGATGAGLFPSSATASAEIFDPVTRTFQLTGTMTVPRERHTATFIPGAAFNQPDRVFITGGATPSGPSRATEIYSVGLGQFTNSVALLEPRIRHTATLLPKASFNNRNPMVLIVGGGLTATALDPAEIIGLEHPVLGGVTPIPMPFVRDPATLITGGCNVFVFGGTTDVAGQHPSSIALWYGDMTDPTNPSMAFNYFLQYPPMPMPRSLHGVVNTIGNRFFITGGVSAFSPQVNLLTTSTVFSFQ